MSGEELLVDAVAAAGEEREAGKPGEAGDSKVSGNPAAVACVGVWSVHWKGTSVIRGRFATRVKPAGWRGASLAYVHEGVDA